MQYEYNQLTGAVKEFIDIMKDSGLSYLKVKNDKFELELGEKSTAMPVMTAAQPMTIPAPEPSANTVPASNPPCKCGNIVKSPIVGTFYASPAPGKPAYTSVGKTVAKGDVLFIIESMKLMNEVTGEFSGTVAEIFVKDGEAVEFDQPIMRIE